LTLSGLLMSCGLVPTGWWCLVGTTTANGMRCIVGAIGHSYSDTCGVSGVAGDRLACVNMPGLVRLDSALRPPGLDTESASSLSEWPPRLPFDWLSSDWLPESPPLSMYRMQRFLRLQGLHHWLCWSSPYLARHFFILLLPPSWVSCLRFLFLARVALVRDDQSG
jgi:hypothetical protein